MAAGFDDKIRKDAKAASGENYAAIVELSTRQAFATFELTVGETKDDIMGFLKEISSNGDMGVSNLGSTSKDSADLFRVYSDRRCRLPPLPNPPIHQPYSHQVPA